MSAVGGLVMQSAVPSTTVGHPRPTETLATVESTTRQTSSRASIGVGALPYVDARLGPSTAGVTRAEAASIGWSGRFAPVVSIPTSAIFAVPPRNTCAGLASEMRTWRPARSGSGGLSAPVGASPQAASTIASTTARKRVITEVADVEVQDARQRGRATPS